MQTTAPPLPTSIVVYRGRTVTEREEDDDSDFLYRYPWVILLGADIFFVAKNLVHFFETGAFRWLVVAVFLAALGIILTLVMFPRKTADDEDDPDDEAMAYVTVPYIAFEPGHLWLLGDAAIPWSAISMIRVAKNVLIPSDRRSGGMPFGTFLVLSFDTEIRRNIAAGRHQALLTRHNARIARALTRQTSTASPHRILGVEIDNTVAERPAANLTMDSTHIGEWTRRYWEAARAQQPPPATRPTPP